MPRGGSSSNPGGEPARAGGQGNAKTAAIQAQIDDTVGIMRDNITKVAERGERLDNLQDKTGESSSSQLRSRKNVGGECAGALRCTFEDSTRKGNAALTIFFPDNLAVSAQGFRRGANRVRKV